LIFASILVLIATLLVLFRVSILQGIGNILIDEDNPVKAEAAFVLSGNSTERAQKAYNLYQQNYINKIYTTGSQINDVLMAVDVQMTDAELTQKILLDMGIDSSIVTPIDIGTSTFEESEEILGYSQQKGFKRIIVISSKFHTRRIRSVFNKKFHEAGIEVFVIGADPLKYKIEDWWNYEQSLIFVNNEYIKMVYYWLKY